MQTKKPTSSRPAEALQKPHGHTMISPTFLLALMVEQDSKKEVLQIRISSPLDKIFSLHSLLVNPPPPRINMRGVMGDSDVLFLCQKQLYPFCIVELRGWYPPFFHLYKPLGSTSESTHSRIITIKFIVSSRRVDDSVSKGVWIYLWQIRIRVLTLYLVFF